MDNVARRPALRGLLTEWRSRLQPEDLGFTAVGRRRVPGLRREEVAKFAGISEAWYTMLETGRSITVSPRTLDRLAAALRLSEDEKIQLFSLAIDELPTLPSAMSKPVRDLGFAKRLWAASSVDEVLTVATEEATAYFSDAVLTFFVCRVAVGRWDRRVVTDRGIGGQSAKTFAEFASMLTPARFDEVFLYPLLSEAGTIGTSRSYEHTSIAAEHRALEAKHKLQAHFLHARIRSRTGVVGGITVQHSTSRIYSSAEQAFISDLAYLASLALR